VDAKAETTELLDQLGYDAVDVGPLADIWRFQRASPV
jgi:predicted dinucleotide-binding enzyme